MGSFSTKDRVLLFFYTILGYFLVPLAIIRLLLKSLHNPAYRYRMKERFGIFTPPNTQGGLWIHAASVGEAIVAASLIHQIRLYFPTLPITVTTMSPTGSERVTALLQDQVFHVYVPYDIPGAIKRFLDLTQPQAAIMIETEIWPNILYYCNQRNIPVGLANARLSERSAEKYARFLKLTTSLLKCFHWIAAQSAADAQRYVQLGTDPKNVLIVGNIKFDQQLPIALERQAAALRELWQQRPVWIAASTHEGEEALILAALAQVKRQLPNVLLVIVPRHPERFGLVADECRKQGYSVQLRSEGSQYLNGAAVFIGDTMGELLVFYSAADIAFVGGSLVPVGGHNILEPAALGKPILTGPYMFNFAEITQLLTAAGGLIQIHDAHMLAETVLELFQNDTKRHTMGVNALTVVEQNRGNTQTYIALVKTLLQDCR